MAPTPLLILSDAPTANTGLARIARDLATRIHANLSDYYQVGTLGYAGTGSKNLPFPQYSIQSKVTENGWYVPELRHVWEDFAEGRRGIVFTIWDPSRMKWFARPEPMRTTGPHQEIALWLAAAPFEKWGYLPIDATGPRGNLTLDIASTITGYDRALCYSAWAENVVSSTIGPNESTRLDLRSLPHGIDTSVFKPRDRRQAREHFRNIGFAGLTDDCTLIGIVATNQARKDYGLAMQVCSILQRDEHRDVRVWIHTDSIKRYWDLVALVTDFGLIGRVLFSLQNFSDEQMSWLYSACDVTLGIGLGEGFGYPIFESLACGVPCIHGAYGGAAEHLPDEFLVRDTLGYRFEGQFNCERPVYSAQVWARRVIFAMAYGVKASLPDHLDWVNLWPKWEQFFLAEGRGNVLQKSDD